MRKPMILVCLIGCPLLFQASVKGAEDAHLAALVDQLQNRSDLAASSAAFMELRRMLKAAPSETVSAAQTSLCGALRGSNDSWALRRENTLVELTVIAAPSALSVSLPLETSSAVEKLPLV